MPVSHREGRAISKGALAPGSATADITQFTISGLPDIERDGIF